MAKSGHCDCCGKHCFYFTKCTSCGAELCGHCGCAVPQCPNCGALSHNLKRNPQNNTDGYGW
jgi:hypothetical protein